MLIYFIVIMAALGAAFVFQGRERRGLLVLLVACAAPLPIEATSGRWNWLAFSIAMCGGALAGIACAKADPAPAPEEPERSPDYCITHGKLEPKEER